MKTKVGEASGKTLYSVDGTTWFSTPEMAQKVYDDRQNRLAFRKKVEAA